MIASLQASSSPIDINSISGEACNALVHVIALQLLASCLTFLPPSDASHIPLFPQKKEARFVSALRLHSQYQFCPAAGHYARASSETSFWPGLDTGPAVEEQLVDTITFQRCFQKRSSEAIPYAAASGWTDGPVCKELLNTQEDTHSTSSSSSYKPGLLSILMCQSSSSKNSRQKHDIPLKTWLSLRSSSIKKKKQRSDYDTSNPQAHHNPLHSLTTLAVQRMPSALHSHHTKSASRMPVNNPLPTPQVNSRRHGSNPSISSPLNYAVEYPETCRTPATPAGHPMEQGAAQPTQPWQPRDRTSKQEHVETAQSRSHDATLLSCGLGAFPQSPRDDGYFNAAYPFFNVEHDDESESGHEDEEGENSSNNNNNNDNKTGLGCIDDPRREKIRASSSLATDDEDEDADADDEYSSESDMERNRKRKSIKCEAGGFDRRLARRFGPQDDDRLVEE